MCGLKVLSSTARAVSAVHSATETVVGGEDAATRTGKSPLPFPLHQLTFLAPVRAAPVRKSACSVLPAAGNIAAAWRRPSAAAMTGVKAVNGQHEDVSVALAAPVWIPLESYPFGTSRPRFRASMENLP